MLENFKYYLDKYNPVLTGEKPDPAVISRLSKIYPASLVEFISEYGFPSFHGGLFQFCDPEDFKSVLALIFKADPDFNHDECHVVGYTAFGQLRCWSPKFFEVDIELPLGTLYCPLLTIPGWQQKASADHVASGMVPDREDADFLDVNGESMFDRCVAAYGPLKKGECFGFVPALAISGAFGPLQRVENIKRLLALEHFSILAQLDEFNLMKITPSDIVPVRRIG